MKIEDFPEIRRKLLEWGRKNFRDFPWRHTRDPYKVFVAEVLLHRTRAEQVVPVYLEVLKRFPTVKHLAMADLHELEEIIHPLGLKWRVKNMHKTAQIIAEKYDGRMPRNRDELLLLPGIDHYIAGAILCFAYGEPQPLLDTNTVRVVGRLLGIPVNDSSRRSRKFHELMSTFLDREHPREFNFALIDFAAAICIKKTHPRCQICPFSNLCAYHLCGGEKHA